MNVLVTIDHHFIKLTQTGEVFCKTIHDSTFWERYLLIYERVFVLCRMKETDSKETVAGYLLSSHPKVQFIGIPDFKGPKEYAKRYLSILYSLRKKLSKLDDFIPIFRLPSTIGFLAYKILRNRNLYYGVEVVADPSSAYKKKGSATHFMVEKSYSLQLKKICKNATGVAYVTESFLQKKYPTKGIEESYTSLDLFDDFYYKKKKRTGYNIVHVGHINSEVKGHRTVIEAMKILVNYNEKYQCYFVGDGRMKNTFERLVQKYGLQNNITFLGEVSKRKDLKNILVNSDIFVFPSHSEGLPRSVIEAMACSLPVISTPICGIPELVNKKFLINYEEYSSYANKIIELMDNDEMYCKEAEANYKKAGFFRYDFIKEKRLNFYNLLYKKVKKIYDEM